MASAVTMAVVRGQAGALWTIADPSGTNSQFLAGLNKRPRKSNMARK